MNHREIDAKVAECLGWTRRTIPSNEAIRLFGDIVSNVAWVSPEGKVFTDPPNFLDGNGMLLLIEEARKQEYGVVFYGYKHAVTVTISRLETCEEWEVTEKETPLALALAFLKAKGVDITPYLKGVTAE